MKMWGHWAESQHKPTLETLIIPSLLVILLKTVHRRHKAVANVEKVKKNILGHLQVRWKEVSVKIDITEQNTGISLAD